MASSAAIGDRTTVSVMTGNRTTGNGAIDGWNTSNATARTGVTGPDVATMGGAGKSVAKMAGNQQRYDRDGHWERCGKEGPGGAAPGGVWPGQAAKEPTETWPVALGEARALVGVAGMDDTRTGGVGAGRCWEGRGWEGHDQDNRRQGNLRPEAAIIATAQMASLALATAIAAAIL